MSTDVRRSRDTKPPFLPAVRLKHSRDQADSSHLVADREHRIAQGNKEFMAGYSRWAEVVVWDGLEKFRRGAELFNCSANGFFAHLLVSPWAVLRVIVCAHAAAPDRHDPAVHR